MRNFIWPFLLSVFVLTGCSDISKDIDQKSTPQLRLELGSFDELDGWDRDDFSGFSAAFEQSCARIAKASPDKMMGKIARAGTYGDWQGICQGFSNIDHSHANAVRAFIERMLVPYRVYADREREGLFTGYYEASLHGSRVKSARYNVPLYARANDLVMVQLGDFRDDLKGRRIAGRVVHGRLRPYESREEIVAGAWPHNDNVLVWVDSAVDAFFVQIQGSGVVQMDDGSVMRIGYAGQNGHPYFAIGRELIKCGVLTKESVSMQSIRAWLEDNPRDADEVMNTNASYVFFRELDGEGPIGGEGVALTSGRSLAVDRSLWPYGLPFWLDAVHAESQGGKLQRLMVGQDTGGAIRGPVRGDVFWGYGSRAEALAGPMKTRGQYWVLLPR